MAQLPPDGTWLMQQIGGDVVLFHRYTEREIASFNPQDPQALGSALRAIHESADLDDEQKSFAGFWAGYFYAHAAPAETRIDEAVQLILKYAGTDGAHHKQWVLAQVLSQLSGGSFELEDKGTAP